MSDHRSTLVPIETWCYESPELRRRGRVVDLGLFAEALIYYDQVLVNPVTDAEFNELILWFIQQNKFGDLITLLNEDVIRFYYYGFMTAPINNLGTFVLMNIQDDDAPAKSMFGKYFLPTTNLSKILPNARKRMQLLRAIEGKVIEAKADSFGRAIDNANEDTKDPDRCRLLLQTLLDEVFPDLGLKKPPTVEARIVEDGPNRHITYNQNLNEIARRLGKELNFHPGAPLAATAISNRFLWSASEQGCDLYLSSPMSILVGDKLFESSRHLARPHNIIDQLETEVEFPDIRQLVNSGQMDLATVLEFRRKGERFRKWLQEEGERDRNAIIAYHSEVAKESGWTRTGRKALRLFGYLSGISVGVAASTVGGIPGGIVGTAAGGAVSYTLDLASKIGENWRPVVFGKWMDDRIKKVILR